MERPNLLTETKPIHGIYDYGGNVIAEVGQGRCVEIAVVPEPGLYNNIAFFAAYAENNELLSRIPAWMAQVQYKTSAVRRRRGT